MEYRLGKKSDIDEICRMIAEAIREMELDGIFQWDGKYPTREDFLHDIADNSLYIVTEKEELAAIYVINGSSDKEYKDADWNCGEETARVLHRFCVSPKFQHRGMGQKILKHIENQIFEMGYRSVRLDVFSENPYAQKLYLRNGYQKTGFADWEMGRFDLMEKKL